MSGCVPEKEEQKMGGDSVLETKRLWLRKFEPADVEAMYLLLSDEEVNQFLPWFPVKSREEAEAFCEKRFRDQPYCYVVCLREENRPIGYVTVSCDDSYDFGYALRREFWHQGIASEGSLAVIERLKRDGFPYITATHDRKNPRSGGVMRQIGMRYCYSYEEQWQPKNIPVVFRMYQLNLDGNEERVYQKYWNLYSVHFIEQNL